MVGTSVGCRLFSKRVQIGKQLSASLLKLVKSSQGRKETIDPSI